ncbi:MAG: hypothetical protein M0P39_05270 [Rhodocyclaceae bacterium]|jgi:hypothetical protein|nr:hypothetical protein [Rhodocyclaceae bacterium]
MTAYEQSLLHDFQETLEANAGHLDSTGQALLRAIGRGSPELYDAVEKLMDRISGFAPASAESIH